MIPQLSSKELNEILSTAQEQITEVDQKMQVAQADMEKKMNIIRYETDYTSQQFAKLAAGLFTPDSGMMSLVNVQNGNFERYGIVAHGAMTKDMTNVFNLKISGSGEIFFRNDIKASVNGVYSNTYQDMLKHESLDREIFFEEFSSPEIKLVIETEEASKMLGPTKFNIIEIDSFLNGSYDIQSMKIYTVNDEGEIVATPDTYAYPSVGKLRIVFPTKRSFYKIEIVAKSKLEYVKNERKVYPFGIKHIYFYDADFRSDSYAIIPIRRDSYIATIREDIRIRDVAGTRQSTLSDEGITVFADYANGVLDTQIYSTTSTQRNEIARNLSVIYAKVPLMSKALIGIGFEVETRT